MNAACPAASDHDEEYVCYICGWTIEHELRKTPPVHPDDMPTATGPDRVAQAIARDRGGWAPKARVTFAQTGESPIFEDATRAEAERYARTPRMNVGTVTDRLAEAYMAGAAATRDHLSEQEPSDAEVEAALSAWMDGAKCTEPAALGEYDERDVRDMRDALRAAARIRKEQER